MPRDSAGGMPSRDDNDLNNFAARPSPVSNGPAGSVRRAGQPPIVVNDNAQMQVCCAEPKSAMYADLTLAEPP